MSRSTPARGSRASSARPRPSESRALWRFLAPRHWPVWFALAIVRLLGLMPRRAQLALGRGLGRLAGRLLGRRRHVARRNLELAFPELDDAGVDALLQDNFADLGMALFDTTLALWGNDRQLDGMLDVEGVERIEALNREGRGVLMLSGHYSALELCGRLFARRVPIALTYRELGQPLVDEIMRRGRRRDTTAAIPKRAIREALTRLRQGENVWLAMDQAKMGGANATVAPFFGRPAVTTTSPSRIAQATGAAVMMMWPERLPDGRIRIRCLPALADFPSDDWSADAARINALLEAHVREVPEQYFWVHRRFKGVGDEDPYRREP